MGHFPKMEVGGELERFIKNVAHRVSWGRVAFLRGRRRSGYEAGGRESLVTHFSRLRTERKLPPVLVFEGPAGIGKSDLLRRCEKALQRSGAWRWAEEIHASVNLVTSPRDPVAFFTELRSQFRRNSSLLRPATTPRFDAMLQRLEHERGAHNLQPPSALTASLDAAVDTGAAVALHALGSSTLIKPPLVSRAIRMLGRAGMAWRPTPAARWVRDYIRQLPRRSIASSVTGERIDALYRGLGDAMAADLTAMHTRSWWLKIGRVTVFVYAYDQIETQVRSRFLVDFSRRAREVGAPLFLVLGCRNQQLWSSMLNHSNDIRNYNTFKASDAVEIHPLAPLGYEQSILELDHMGVPAGLCPRLAEVSQGLPLALRLFGQILGREVGPVDHDLERTLIEKIPPLEGEITDAWVRSFCAVVCPIVLKDFSDSTRRHALAATTIRTFDRAFLAEVLGEAFSADSFDELISGPLVHIVKTPKTFGVEQSFRVRSFLRDFVATSALEREMVARWHQRAIGYLRRLQAQERTGEADVTLRVEIIYHQFALDPEQAGDLLRAEWEAAYKASQLGTCEQLVDAAHDAARFSRSHAAEILCLAGRLHLGTGTLELAERRLLEAAERVSEVDRITYASIHAALASTFRRQHRYGDAANHLGALEAVSDGDPVLSFYVPWTETLIAKEQGYLNHAWRLVGQARRRLDFVLESRGVKVDAEAARYGLGPMTGRNGDLHRHEADIARRAGQYSQCRDGLIRAREQYQAVGNEVGSACTQIVESRLLRMQGYPNEAAALAEEAMQKLSLPESNNLSAAMMAARSAAQACLGAGNLGDAERHARSLLDGPQPIYPPGRAVGHYILGEIARLRGRVDDARKYLRYSLDYSVKHALFERHYANLVLIELDRLQGASKAAINALRSLAKEDTVCSHPTLQFWVSITAARAVGGRDRKRWLSQAETTVRDLACDVTSPLPERQALMRESNWDGDETFPIAFCMP